MELSEFGAFGYTDRVCEAGDNADDADEEDGTDEATSATSEKPTKGGGYGWGG